MRMAIRRQEQRSVLCRHLSSRLFSSNKLADFHPLYDYLSSLSYDGQSLMLNDRITGPKSMAQSLDNAERFLSSLEDDVSILNPISLRIACLISGIRLFWVL